MSLKRRLATVGREPDDLEWAALARRRADGSTGRPTLLFLVTSTGIVCRQGCPARTPRRENVRIVPSIAEATAAGARTCLRCRPAGEVGGRRAANPQPTDLMLRGLARLETALNTRSAAPTDRALAAELGVSERRLRTIFQTTLGVTPRQWLSARRAELLREQLAKGVDVLPAVYDAGYDSASAAYEAAEGELGMPLGRYRKRGAGERIGWTIVPIPDGVALVAATRRGLCAVRLGDDASDLEHELRTEFAAAELVRDDGGLVAAAAIVTELANGRVASTALSLPLDVVGTAFKRRVWRALRDIPPGETRSYGEVAKAVGSPAAVRAVASACATNPVALVVPCHRVIGADGALRGYRWGIQRKQRLLRLEAESVAARDQRAAV